MPDGFITLIGGSLRGRVRRLLTGAGQAVLEEYTTGPVADADGHPPALVEGAGRRLLFDVSDDPPPAWSSIPPRRTGWEREYQQ